VAASAVIVVGFLAVLAALAIGSTRERIVSYAVKGTVSGVRLDLRDADVTIVRGGQRRTVDVHRTDRFAFGHDVVSDREVSAGVFGLTSRCPTTVLHSCAASYRVVVPDSVSIDIRTTTGTVTLAGYRGPARIATRSGDVRISGYCGFLLEARSESGDIDAASMCATPQLSLRATSGDVHAIVPPGRYELDAETAGGRQTVRGIDQESDAPFSVQALSSSGDVLVEGRP
jgi:hypothetical protein